MANDLLYNHAASMGQSRELNNSEYHFDRSQTRAPESVITIFTVNTQDLYSTSAGIRFSGRKEGQRYLKVASLNDPKYYVDNLSVEGSKNQKKIIADDGKWVAMDWLNPQNIYSLDQSYIVPNAVQDGTNLLERGMFFIVRPYDPINGNVDDQPTEEEAKGAEKRLNDRYTALVRIYRETVTARPASLPNIMNEEMIAALNYAGIETPYNSSLKQKVQCSTCGDMIGAGVKFHKSEALGGILCIQPTAEGWRAAVLAGIKSKDDVPDEFRDKRGLGRPVGS